MLALDDGFTSALDIAMQARRSGEPGEKTPKGILTRFGGLTIGRLLSEIEEIASPELTGLGLLLLQLSSEVANFFNKGIDRIVRQAKLDGESHDISVPIERTGSGITIHCNGLPEHVGRERLFAHCTIRKYDAKANAWYGLLLDPATGGIRGALVIEQDWKPDPHMDAVMAAWPKRPPVLISQLASGRRKIGRNEPCPCGSGRKYKKCCLDA
jgi:SEC-C motif